MTAQQTPVNTGAYRAAGWQITPNGRPNVGQKVGPCARCHTPTVRYGPTGGPLCLTCRPGGPI